MSHNTIDSINPATGNSIGTVAHTSPHDVNGLVEQARSAQPAWAAVSLKERSAMLRQVQALLLEEAEDMAALISREMGRPFTEALVLEVQSALDLLGYHATHARRFLSDHGVPLHHPFFWRRESRMVYEPLGVLGIIAPWNWPLLIPLGGIVPALLAGNAVVFKPSELTPLTGQYIHNLFIKAGVPADVFQIIHGEAHTGQALVDAPLEKLFFTGSTHVGQIIYKHAAKKLMRCVLEMGGSDAAIVCADADLETASSGIVWGAFNNAGQNCNSIERCFVHREIATEFIDRVVQKAEALRLGSGDQTDTDIGPLASQAQLKKTHHSVNEEIKNGAALLTGGHGLKDEPGYFYKPTVLLRDKSQYSEKDEEIFGPVLWITEVESDEEAIQLANRSRYGLASSVWTSNPQRGHRLARQVKAGTCMINDSIVSFGLTEAGWTGVGESGIGWVHGEKGLDEMVNIKYINRDPLFRRQNFWWFPYGGSMQAALKGALPFLFGPGILRRLPPIPALLKNFAGDFLLNRPRSDKY